MLSCVSVLPSRLKRTSEPTRSGGAHLRQRLHDGVQQRAHPRGHLQQLQHCRHTHTRAPQDPQQTRTYTLTWVCVCVCVATSRYSEDPHDSDDGGIDGQRRAHLQLLQRDAHDGERHDGDVQLIPPEHRRTRLCAAASARDRKARARAGGIRCGGGAGSERLTCL